jgi:hypothetical protein
MKVRLADVYPAAAGGRRPQFIDGSGRSVWLAQGGGPDDDKDGDADGDSGTGAVDDKSGTDGNPEDDKDGKGKDDSEALKQKLRLADKRAAEAEKKLREAEDKDKSELEVAKRKLEEVTANNAKLTEANHELSLTNAFLMVNEVTWFDPEEALASARRRKLLDGVQAEDGEVDNGKLKKALEALAKASPHLVKKGKDDEGPGSTATHTVGNGAGKGKGQQFDRETLAKRYSALRRS